MVNFLKGSYFLKMHYVDPTFTKINYGFIIVKV